MKKVYVEEARGEPQEAMELYQQILKQHPENPIGSGESPASCWPLLGKVGIGTSSADLPGSDQQIF